MADPTPDRHDASGLVVVDKPRGWTSHQVVGRLRRILGTRRIGHAGTLDPMATGVLLVGVNRATRLLGHLSLSDKSYLATIRLGQATVTDDAEGDVVSSADPSWLTQADVESAIRRYRGTIVQIPSAVSAIKVDGQRAYALVRRGERVDLAGRTVTVSRYEVTGFRHGSVPGHAFVDVDVAVDCSSGTYIRALARDLGEDLGTGGHLTSLRRTRVGSFELTEPHLSAADLDAGSGPVPLIAMGVVARRCFPVVEVDDAAARDVGYGRPLELSLPGDPTALLHGDDFLALYRPVADGRGVPVAVFAPNGAGAP